MTFFSNISSLFSKTRDKQAPEKKVKTTKAAQTQAPQAKKAQITQPRPQPQPKSKVEETIKAEPSPKKSEVQSEVDSMLREAKAQAREIIVEAKDEALQIKAEAERSARQQENSLNQRERTLDKKIDKLDSRLDELSRKEKQLNEQEQALNKLKTQLESTKNKMLQRLEEISSMTEQEAKTVLLDGLEKKLTQEMAQLIRQKEEEAQQEAKDKAKAILIDAMKHGATDYVAEYTVSVVNLPSEDVKGKIIGKSGRNIHAFERLTGVDLDLDYSDTEVRLSCFDPVRREIGRIALERLIKDGRIQPSRIEQTVKKVQEEVEQIMFDAGKELCQRVGVYNLPNGLIKTLGRFKYRFSYGQNMIKHTIEETKIGVKIAHELGLDVNVVKLGCLLHDIGKVSDNPEGNHVEMGVKIAKKFNMPEEVIACIAQHHEDEPFSGPEQMAVYIADAISGARPGARYENIDEYLERLENLEQIATSYSEVEEAYAVKAGREVRVLLNPENSKDDDVTVLANKIKDKIEDKLTYPGTVTVNVIRETRAEATAK
jgi:ribonuclease Y